MRQFNLEEAKAGAPVAMLNWDGGVQPARIVCYDRLSPIGCSIAALVEQPDGKENALFFFTDGRRSYSSSRLVMVGDVPTKEDGFMDLLFRKFAK